MHLVEWTPEAYEDLHRFQFLVILGNIRGIKRPLVTICGNKGFLSCLNKDRIPYNDILPGAPIV